MVSIRKISGPRNQETLGRVGVRLSGTGRGKGEASQEVIPGW